MNKRKNENMFSDGRLFFGWITINSEQLNDGSAKKFSEAAVGLHFFRFRRCTAADWGSISLYSVRLLYLFIHCRSIAQTFFTTFTKLTRPACNSCMYLHMYV